MTEIKKINIDIPLNEGISLFSFEWEDGFVIKTSITEDGCFYLKANSAGLISIAKHLLSLAQKEVPSYGHFHLEEFTSLEDGSVEMIIEKDDNLE